MDSYKEMIKLWTALEQDEEIDEAPGIIVELMSAIYDLSLNKNNHALLLTDASPIVRGICIASHKINKK